MSTSVNLITKGYKRLDFSQYCTYKVASEEAFSTGINNIFTMLMMTNLFCLQFAIEIMFIGNALGSCHDEVSYNNNIIVMYCYSITCGDHVPIYTQPEKVCINNEYAILSTTYSTLQVKGLSSTTS